MFKKILGAAVISIFIFSMAAGALDYSADIINVSRIGKKEETSKGKGYFSVNKWRSEGETEEGKKAITIFRQDKGVLWILMPEEKMYLEQKLDLNKLIESSSEIEEKLLKEMKIKVYRKKVGSEKISGILCNKYKITTKDLSEKEAKTYTMYQWISVKYKGLVMKTAFEDGSYTMLKNVIFKKQPAYLFEIPKGYKKFSMEEMMLREEEGEEEERGEEEAAEDEKALEMLKESIPSDLPIKLPFGD